MIGRNQVRGRWLKTASLLSVVAASGAMVVAPAMSSASAAVRAATTKVTLTRSHSPVVTGTAVIFSGQVTPKGQRSITLEQKLRGKWKPQAATKSARNGTFSFRWVVSAPGTLAFRVGVKATKSAKGTNSPAVDVIGERWHYLADLPDINPVCGCQFGPIEINGTTYAHSVFEDETSGTSTIDYNLKRSCVTLSTEAGIGDNSTSDASEEMDILLDGTNKFSHDFGLGQSAKVSLKVSGNLRLELSWTYLAGSQVDVGWGNARVLCKW